MIHFQFAAIVIEAVLALSILGVVIRTAASAAPSALSAARQRTGDVLIYVAVFVFLASGISKLARVPLAVTEMGLLGLTGPKYWSVAVIEIISGVLMLIRPLRSVALLFIAAHVGGAICAHLIAGQYFAMVPSAIVLSVACLGAFLRHPEVLWSLSELSQPSPRPSSCAQTASDLRGMTREDPLPAQGAWGNDQRDRGILGSPSTR